MTSFSEQPFSIFDVPAYMCFFREVVQKVNYFSCKIVFRPGWEVSNKGEKNELKMGWGHKKPQKYLQF